MQYIILDQVGTEITLVFIIIIMAFGVLNTSEMSFHERRREFGILIALGTPHKTLFTMIISEVILLLLIGISIGGVAAVVCGAYLENNPILLTGESADALVSAGGIPMLRTIVDFTELYIGIIKTASKKT